MHPGFLALIAAFCIMTGACKPKSKSCNYLPAGVGLEFRIVDTGGRDVLYATRDTPLIIQPCRSTPLTRLFKDYRVPGGADSGTIISFGNLRTPEYAEPSECYRIYFNWINDDEDTIDWHYRIEEVDGCNMQIIDYMSYNGIQAKKKNDYAHEYYECVKR
jgi:hypothetical protein